MEQSKKMALTAYEALDEKKAEEIKVIGIGEISILADYFIIAGGGSKPQLQAMINNVQEKMRIADGACVGTSLKKDGPFWYTRVDVNRVKTMMELVKEVRATL